MDGTAFQSVSLAMDGGRVKASGGLWIHLGWIELKISVGDGNI